MAKPQTHEAKGMPILNQEEKVVEAYGAQKCPKLVSQISQSSNAVLRNNALKVLCEELRNPYSAAGCVRSGVVPVLNDLTTTSPVAETRQASSKALATLAVDSNGRAAMIESESAKVVVKALSDADAKVRANVYDALLNLSAVRAGVDALVSAGYPLILVGKGGSEVDDVRHLPLQLLYNCIKNEEGLSAALEGDAVTVCIDNLPHKSSLVREHAANTLGFLCFADSAKVTAIQNDAVEKLSSLLDDALASVRASAAAALMSIVQTDAGKKALTPANVVPKLIKLLKDDSVAVKLNVLKTIACAAVHPEARREMRESSDCLPVIHGIMDAGDKLLAKHADIARQAVLWQP